MAGHLIHIGFPKAGSTSLQAWFETHPQLGFAKNGLAGYREARTIALEAADADSPAVRWRVTSLEGLSMPIAAAGAVERLAAVDPKTMTEARLHALSVLRGLFPRSTILIVTRGFRGMLASTYSQYVRRGGTLAMADLFAAFDDRIGEYVAHWYDYDGTIALYAEAFGMANVLVLPFELLRDDPGSFTRELEQRLGLEPADVPLSRLNPSLSEPELAWYPIASRGVRRLRTLVGDDRGTRLWSRYLRRVGGPRAGAVMRTISRVTPRDLDGLVDVPAYALESCRGLASSLRDLPHYSPYAAEYLFEAR
jgi:hypothetical protein